MQEAIIKELDAQTRRSMNASGLPQTNEDAAAMAESQITAHHGCVGCMMVRTGRLFYAQMLGMIG